MPPVLGSAVARSIVALTTLGHLPTGLLDLEGWVQRQISLASESEGGR